MSDLITPKGGETGEEIQSPPSEMVCPNCRVQYRPGFATCSDCRVPLVSELPAPIPPPQPEEVMPISMGGLKCQQHSGVDAVARCRACSSGVCSTCDFQMSGLHFCPKCIDNARDEKISPRRKNLAMGAIAIAAYCTLFGLFSFSGVLHRAIGEGNERVLGVLIMYGLYIPSVIGTTLAFSAFERRLKNTHMIWTALIWNASLTAIFILMETAYRIMQ